MATKKIEVVVGKKPDEVAKSSSGRKKEEVGGRGLKGQLRTCRYCGVLNFVPLEKSGYWECWQCHAINTDLTDPF
jgi:hypothetical protein